jgi:hypothetical protein
MELNEQKKDQSCLIETGKIDYIDNTIERIENGIKQKIQTTEKNTMIIQNLLQINKKKNSCGECYIVLNKDERKVFYPVDRTFSCKFHQRNKKKCPPFCKRRRNVIDFYKNKDNT